MAVQTRPYFLTLNGVDHIVEAANPAAAVRHVVGAAVSELRPARGTDVAKWAREGKPIPIAGQAAVVSAPAVESTPGVAVAAGPDDLVPVVVPADADADSPDWTADDALAWLIHEDCNQQALAVFAEIRSTGRMTLEQFDRLRVAFPRFGEAVTATLNGDAMAARPEDQAFSPFTIDDVRGRLEDDPFTLDVVVGVLGDASRADLFVAGEPEA